MEETIDIINGSLAEVTQSFTSGKTRSVAWRKTQLRAIIKLLTENEDKVFDALMQDLGKHPIEAYRDEIGVILKSANYTLSNFEKWMAPKKGYVPPIFFPAKGQVIPEPLGTILVISSWNFPISLSLDPVIGAISAGNTVVLKPSELAPACSSFLANTIPLYLDPKAIKVFEGGASLTQKLLQEKWDKIFFTGSTRVGRIIMSAAAANLTPVALELGGKCPAILDSLTASDLKVSVKRITGGKWGPCSGQACIAIDYVLVEQKIAPVLVELLKKNIQKLYGENLKNLKYLSRIVNKHHFDRVRGLLEDPGVAASVVYGGSVDEENLMIEPTLLLDPPLDAEIMSDEIFGPVLPIITLNKIEESVDFVSSRPKPLVIYAFTKNEALKQKILSGTSSGGVTFNDTVIQFICDGLPFGGVGQSGFGRYHGKYSFDTFSHEKAILHGNFFPEIEPRYPPWNNFKMEFIRLAYNLDYLGLILLILGLRRFFRPNR